MRSHGKRVLLARCPFGCVLLLFSDIFKQQPFVALYRKLTCSFSGSLFIGYHCDMVVMLRVRRIVGYRMCVCEFFSNIRVDNRFYDRPSSDTITTIVTTTTITIASITSRLSFCTDHLNRSCRSYSTPRRSHAHVSTQARR